MTIASTLLSVSGLKPYLIGAAAVAALSVFGWYTVHERNVEHAIDAKKTAALVAASTALNKASEQLADIKELNIGKVYEKYISLPPVADAGLVCHGPAVASVQPSATDGRPELNGPPTPRADDVFDPSGALLTDSRDADAQINGLIDTVLNLEAELQGKTK